MILQQNMELYLDQHVGCFGEFRNSDQICQKRCAINVRCAIEHERNERYEILEELVAADGMEIKAN